MTTATSAFDFVAARAHRAEERMREIHRDNGRALLNFCRNLVSRNAVHTAEDLVQETMLRAWRRLDAVPSEPERQRRWLFTVARRLAVDAHRRGQARPLETELTGVDPAATGGEAAESVVAKLTLLETVARLTAAHRSVLHELFVEGFSLDEAADRLGIPVGTVKSRAHYAMRELRLALLAA